MGQGIEACEKHYIITRNDCHLKCITILGRYTQTHTRQKASNQNIEQFFVKFYFNPTELKWVNCEKNALNSESIMKIGKESKNNGWLWQTSLNELLPHWLKLKRVYINKTLCNKSISVYPRKKTEPFQSIDWKYVVCSALNCDKNDLWTSTIPMHWMNGNNRNKNTKPYREKNEISWWN